MKTEKSVNKQNKKNPLRWIKAVMPAAMAGLLLLTACGKPAKTMEEAVAEADAAVSSIDTASLGLRVYEVSGSLMEEYSTYVIQLSIPLVTDESEFDRARADMEETNVRAAIDAIYPQFTEYFEDVEGASVKMCVVYYDTLYYWYDGNTLEYLQ